MPMATKASCTGRAQTGRLQPRRRIRARTETRPASSTTRRCRIGPAAGAATSREIRSFPASPRCLGRRRRRHGHPRGKLCPPRPPRSPFLVGHHRDASRSLGHFMHAVTGHQTCRRATRRHLVGSPSRTPLRSAAQTAGSPASATCCPDTKPPPGSGLAAAESPRGREPTVSSNSRRLSSWTGCRTSCRRRGSTGIGITGCLRRITGCEKPSRHSRSATSASNAKPRPAEMGTTVARRGAAVTLIRIKSPARTTPPGLPGPS